MPCVDDCCVGGDFNIIKAPEDRLAGSQVTVHGFELLAWERFCLAFRIVDVRHLDGFSKDQRRFFFLVV